MLRGIKSDSEQVRIQLNLENDEPEATLPKYAPSPTQVSILGHA